METLLDKLNPIFNIVEIPLVKAGVTLDGWQRLVYLAMVLFALWYFGRKTFRILKSKTQSDAMADTADIDALLQSKGNFNDSQQAMAQLGATQDQLKKLKRWDELARLYAEAKSPSDAAKYYMKAKMFKEAAQQYAQLGKTAKAAKLMLKAGDFETAGLFYMQQAKFPEAAKAFVKGGHTALAADAHAQAKNGKEAVELYVQYFAAPRDNETLQLSTAESCFALLGDSDTMFNVDPAVEKDLCGKVAAIFEHVERYEVSAELYSRAGNDSRAGEVFMLAGNLQKAASSMKAAGRDKDAARIGGRYYELQKNWKQAAMAYAGAGEFLKSAECFSKANESIRAGEYYEKAGAFARAGLAYATGKRFPKAIESLQKVPEDDTDFNVSRGILGRAFYEIHDFEHCAATLDNHLTGERIEKGNIDYFYMLALAWEQLGKLDKSKDLLYKIGSVDAKYRDLDQRISSIDTRISNVGAHGGSGGQGAAQGQGGGDSVAMDMVKNTLQERYEILSELGRGGMGVVYRAKDKQLDRMVALKFLGALVDNSEEFRQRFIREAQTAARISHPNIVAIYDISASEGKAYIAMEYIEGASLFKHIEEKGKLDQAEAVRIMIQSCEALDAIHKSGIVHRDVKPDNIVIAKGGLVKLMDFGLAKADNNRLTAANMVMGTPAYMAPEQAMGKDVDGRADLYAMGLVLYEMLTGKVVFADGDVMTRQVQEMPPKLGELVEGISPALEHIAYKCVAKAPEARFKTAEDVVIALKAI
ncbi:serine/threonine protein kinase [bacterium AH-315-P07]|nr:serine/threonine protein kinase [bacterium AH-315-P07]